MKLKLDLHMHTKYSPDCFMEISDIVKRAKEVGLSGVAVTDHDTCDGIPEAMRVGRRENFLVVPGIEVKSKDGDILGLGVTCCVDKGLSAYDTVRKIHDAGGVAVAAHPYSVVFHPSGVRGKVRTAGFDVVEVFNSRTYFSNRMACRAAKSTGLSMVASSDAHTLCEIGNSYTIVECRKGVSSVLSEIRGGRTEIVCGLTPVEHIMRWYYSRLRRFF